MLEALSILLVYIIMASIAVLVMAILLVRFGNIEDLNPDSILVRWLRKNDSQKSAENLSKSNAATKRRGGSSLDNDIAAELKKLRDVIAELGPARSVALEPETIAAMLLQKMHPQKETLDMWDVVERQTESRPN